MRDELMQFLRSTDRSSYLALRGKIIASSVYQPYSDEMEKAGKLYEQGKVDEARLEIQNTMPNLLLSARAHQLLSFLHHKLGNEEAAYLEMMIADRCTAGVLASGDGSMDRPYIVTRTSDENGVIQYLGKQVEGQSLIRKGDSHFDLIRCTDKTELWFDITDAYKTLSVFLRE